MRRERRDRVYGPYKHRNRWRVVAVRADGRQAAESYASLAEAQRVVADGLAKVEGRTLVIAVDAYEVSLRQRGLAGVSVTRSRAHLDKLLDLKRNANRPLVWLTPKRAMQLYEAQRASSAVDTHRNALAAGKSFGRFAVAQGWLKADPFAAIKGVGRRKRGKPQIGIDETHRLVAACYADGSRAAIAVATSVLLGCGASEVVQRQVWDLDDGGRVLHVTRGKNRFRVRSIEVPAELQPLLKALAKGRPGAAPLFGEGDLERPTRYWIYHHCKRLCRAAKVREVSPHGLRGTHATIAIGAVSTSHSVAAAVAAAGASLGHAPGSPITATTYAAPGAVAAAQQRATMRVLKGGRP